MYKARDYELKRLVALKLLNASIASDKEWRTRFLREGRALSRLSHPNILSVYRLGFAGRSPYIAMEYLEGDSLRQVLMREQRLPWQRAVNICLQLCGAMNYAHEQGIVHRDLKPDNIILLPQSDDNFIVKVLDFGLARLSDNTTQSRTLTETGELIGSVHYMSPEQCLGKKADARSDIYSVGCILYECLSGEPPYTATNPIGLMNKHVSAPVVSISSLPRLHDELPAVLDVVLTNALAKQPSDRYQSMDDLRRDLSLIACGAVDDEIPVIATNRSSSPLVKSFARCGVIALIILVFTSIIYLNTDEGIAFIHMLQLRGMKPEQITSYTLHRAEELRTQRRNGAALQLLKQVADCVTDPIVRARVFIVLAEAEAARGDAGSCRKHAESVLILVAPERSPDSVLESSGPPHGTEFPQLALKAAECLQKTGANYLFEYEQLSSGEEFKHDGSVRVRPKSGPIERAMCNLIHECDGSQEQLKLWRILREMEIPVVEQLHAPYVEGAFWNTLIYQIRMDDPCYESYSRNAARCLGQAGLYLDQAVILSRVAGNVRGAKNRRHYLLAAAEALRKITDLSKYHSFNSGNAKEQYVICLESLIHQCNIQSAESLGESLGKHALCLLKNDYKAFAPALDQYAIALVGHDRGNFAETEEFLLNARDKLRRSRDNHSVGIYEGALGNLCYGTGRFAQSAQWYLKSIASINSSKYMASAKIADLLERHVQLANCYINLGRIVESDAAANSELQLLRVRSTDLDKSNYERFLRLPYEVLIPNSLYRRQYARTKQLLVDCSALESNLTDQRKFAINGELNCVAALTCIEMGDKEQASLYLRALTGDNSGQTSTIATMLTRDYSRVRSVLEHAIQAHMSLPFLTGLSDEEALLSINFILQGDKASAIRWFTEAKKDLPPDEPTSYWFSCCEASLALTNGKRGPACSRKVDFLWALTDLILADVAEATGNHTDRQYYLEMARKEFRAAYPPHHPLQTFSAITAHGN